MKQPTPLTHSKTMRLPSIAAVAAVVLLASSSTANRTATAGGALTPLAISQVPLTVSTAAHPQVLFALGNSESMDGTLSGAIMTGSGSLASAFDTLKASSSPVAYAVPGGFAPPLQAADASGNAPYTVNQGGVLYDNGASRLNVAKAGIQAIIQAYIQNTDFALETYSTSGTSLYSTWVYYMSPAGSATNPGGSFIFTSTQVAGKSYVNNPCYGYGSASSTVQSNCASILGTPTPGLYVASQVAAALYMEVGASSDDPSINDVLYAGGQPGVYVNYGGTSPATPFPPNFSLGNYNAGNILVTYAKAAPNANRATGPTNAGYVPFSSQVIYSQRGFGYGGSQSATSGNVVVPITSAGTTPTTQTITTAVNTFLPWLAPESNNASSKEIKAVAGQAPTAGLLAKAKSYLTSVTTSNNGCATQQYVVLISDGLPTQDLAGKFWPPLGSAAATGYGVTASFNADGTLQSTNDQALTDSIASLAALRAAGIKTFIIGLGAGVDPNINPQAANTLQAMALAGGNISGANGKAYYPASSPAELVADLNSILLAVQSGTLSTSSAAVNSNRLQSSSVEYQASFNAKDSAYQDWTGDLQALALNPATGAPTGTALWSSQTLLDKQLGASNDTTKRRIVSWNPATTGTSPQPAGAASFTWSSLTAAQQTLLQPSDTLGSNRVDYLRGSTAKEQRNSGTFRNRSHILGDMVNSKPAFVGVPNGGYFSASYRAFVKARGSRPGMLYVGANDGMLHAFSAADGVEQFAFIPLGVFANLDNLSDPLYNQNHRYFVDGAPQSADVQFTDSTWHTLLVGGLGGGGQSVYALDVTTPEGLTDETKVAAAVLWEFSDSTDLGLTYSEPQIAPIAATPNFAVFFGNGYNSTSNKSVLYALDPKDGSVISKIDLCLAAPLACDMTKPNGLSTVAVGNTDGLQGQPITHVYAGDLQGNMWAVNVSNATPALWTARLLFQARDASGAIQPITTAPLVTLHPKYPTQQGLLIMFGTGQLLAVADLSSSQKQSVYGIWDKPGTSVVPTRTALQAQTLSSATSGGLSVLTATSTQVAWATQRGWYVDLITAGQRVVTTPQLLNGAFLTSLNTPPANVCSNAFTGVLLELNFTNGGAFDSPQLDINGDGLITAADQVGGKNPVGVTLSPGYASAPTVVGPTKGTGTSATSCGGANGCYAKLMTIAGSGPQTVSDPNNTPRRVTWWQVQ